MRMFSIVLFFCWNVFASNRINLFLPGIIWLIKTFIVTRLEVAESIILDKPIHVITYSLCAVLCGTNLRLCM